MAGGSCKDLILQKCVLVSYADLLTNFALFASALIGDFVADQTLNNVIFFFFWVRFDLTGQPFCFPCFFLPWVFGGKPTFCCLKAQPF